MIPRRLALAAWILWPLALLAVAPALVPAQDSQKSKPAYASVGSDYLRLLGGEWRTVSFVGHTVRDNINQGVILNRVDNRSPLRKAGLRSGDVVFALGWERQFTTNLTVATLAEHLAVSPEGAEIKLDYLRSMKERRATLKPGKIAPLEVAKYLNGVSNLATLWVANVPEYISLQYSMPPGQGVIVFSVPKGSPFDKGGLKRGDIILGLDEERSPAIRNGVAGAEDFGRLLAALSARGKVKFSYWRESEVLESKISLPAKSRAMLAQRLSEPAPVAAATLQPPPAGPPPAASGTVTLYTDSVTVTPSPVGAGQPFDLAVRFRVADPGAGSERIPARLRYRILAGDKSLLEAAPVAIESFNGGVTEHVLHMRASSQPGYYVVEISLDYKTKRVTETTPLIIE